MKTLTNNEAFREYWNAKRSEVAAIKASGQVLVQFLPPPANAVRTKGRVSVVAPMNRDFNRVARELCGKYRQRSCMWYFKAASLRLVVTLAKRVYGADNVTVRGCEDPTL